MSLERSFGYNVHRTLDPFKEWCYSSIYLHLINHMSYASMRWVITLSLAVFELVLLMIVPLDLPVDYYAFHAIQKVHFIITLVRWNAHFAWLPEWALWRGCSVGNIEVRKRLPTGETRKEIDLLRTCMRNEPATDKCRCESVVEQDVCSTFMALHATENCGRNHGSSSGHSRAADHGLHENCAENSSRSDNPCRLWR